MFATCLPLPFLLPNFGGQDKLERLVGRSALAMMRWVAGPGGVSSTGLPKVSSTKASIADLPTQKWIGATPYFFFFFFFFFLAAGGPLTATANPQLLNIAYCAKVSTLEQLVDNRI